MARKLCKECKTESSLDAVMCGQCACVDFFTYTEEVFAKIEGKRAPVAEFRAPRGFGNKMCVLCGTRVKVSAEECTNSKCPNPIGVSNTFTHKAWDSIPRSEAIEQCVEKVCAHCGRLNPQDRLLCENGPLCRGAGFLKLTKREIYEELIARQTGAGLEFTGGPRIDVGAGFFAAGCATVTFGLWAIVGLIGFIFVLTLI